MLDDHPDVQVHPALHSAYKNDSCRQCGQFRGLHGFLVTATGEHRICPGDWIITNKNGDHYTRKPTSFKETYDAITEEETKS